MPIVDSNILRSADSMRTSQHKPCRFFYDVHILLDFVNKHSYGCSQNTINDGTQLLETHYQALSLSYIYKYIYVVIAMYIYIYI